MKNLNLLTVAVVIFLLQSCTTPPSGSAIYTHLFPIHPEIMGHTDSNLSEARLLDNDGNMYSTFWDLGTSENAGFIKKVELCNQQVKDRELFRQHVELSHINPNDIQPSLFKEHTRCIESHGFTLKNKEAFLPTKFMLTIYRGHSKTSNYMPVGGTYYIGKKNASFIEVYKHVAECSLKIKNSEGGGVIEKYVDNATYVSIEPYLALLQSCLTNFGYGITTDSLVEIKSLQQLQNNPGNADHLPPDLIKFQKNL